MTQILGGDIAIYKIPNRNEPQSSQDEFIVTVMYTDTSTITTTDDECHLVSHQVLILDILGNTEDIELFGSEQVDIGLCVSRDDEGSHNSRCMTTEYTDLVYLAMDRKNKQMKIETVPKIIATEC